MSNLSETIINFNNQNPHLTLTVGISTTSFKEKSNALSYTSYPRKLTDKIYYFHCVFKNNNDANNFINATKNIISFFFIDIENKNHLFDWKLITKNHNYLNFLKFEPNQITVNAILNLIFKKSEGSVLIIGSGNIASSICFRMKLTGWKFYWISDNKRESLSRKLMKSNFNKQKLINKNINFDYIVNTVPIDFNLNLYDLINLNTLFIEVTGKPLNYLKDLNCSCIRLDVSEHLIAQIKLVKDLQNKQLRFGRKKLGDKFICSGGWIGDLGDIIVDNYRKPKFIIGISDGNGGFKKRLNTNFSLDYFLK